MRNINVILIHGTFARDAEWCKPDSQFCKSLKLQLRQLDMITKVSVFNWSGKNSHQARHEASSELAEYVKGLKHSANCPLLIIAHSHGGTVTRLAAPQIETINPKTSIVTLGTPYIDFHPRNFILFSIIFGCSFLLLLISLLAFGAMTKFLPLDAIPINDSILTGFVFIAIAIIFLLYLRKTLANKSKKIAEKYGFHDTKLRILNLRFRFDEARYYLGVWQSLTSILLSTQRVLIYLFSGFGIGVLALILLDISPASYREIVFLNSFFTSNLNDMDIIDYKQHLSEGGFVPLLYAFSFILLSSAYLVFHMLVVNILIWVGRRGWYSFGGEGFLWTTLVKISVNPPNLLPNIQNITLANKKLNFNELAHSSFFSDSRIPECIRINIFEKLGVPKSRKRLYPIDFLLFVGVAAGVFIAFCLAHIEIVDPINFGFGNVNFAGRG